MTIIKRRLTRAARRLIDEMDAWSTLDQRTVVTDGWCPMTDEEFDLEPFPVDGDDEGDSGEDADTIPFSHFSRQAGGTKTFFRSFSSVLDFCRQPFANPENEKLFNLEQNNGDFDDYAKHPHLRAGWTNEKWYGAKSPLESMRHATHGWPEGGDRIRKMMETINAPPPVDVRRRLSRGDQGDELDIHAVYRGGLDRAWTRRHRRQTRSRLNVRLVVHLGGSKEMESEEMFWRGAAAVKATELLEAAGYRVEVIAVDYHASMDPEDKSHGYASSAFGSMVVKDAGQPLDIEQVAGVVCNAGFFRTFGFRSAYAMLPHRIRETQYTPTRDGRKVYRFISRCYVGFESVVKLGNLDDDGTLTIEVKKFISGHDSAERWVRKAIESVDPSTLTVDDE